MRDIKLLHAADIHLDSPFESLTAEEAKDRRAQQRTIMKKLAELAEENACEAMVLPGDIFDNINPEKETKEEFCKALAALRIPVLISPGNHDYYVPGGLWDSMPLPGNVFVFKNNEIKAVELKDGGLRFWGAAFVSDESQGLLENFEAPIKTDNVYDIMVIHGEVCSGNSKYNPITVKQLEKSCMDYVALGHIHKRAEPEYAGMTPYAWPGCTEGRGFDETGEKGAYIVTLSEKGVSTEFKPLDGVRYEILELGPQEGNLKERVILETAALSEKDYLRLILKGEWDELPDTEALRKSLEGYFALLQIRDETTKKENLWQHAGEDTLLGVFLAKLKRQYDETDLDEMKNIIELAARCGIAAIENGGRA